MKLLNLHSEAQGFLSHFFWPSVAPKAVSPVCTQGEDCGSGRGSAWSEPTRAQEPPLPALPAPPPSRSGCPCLVIRPQQALCFPSVVCTQVVLSDLQTLSKIFQQCC